jgi:hypothetical protein
VDAEPLVGRRRRATAVIALAAIAIAGASIAFLYSAQSSKPEPAAASDHPLLVTRDFVTYSFTSPTEGWAMDISLWHCIYSDPPFHISDRRSRLALGEATLTWGRILRDRA